MLYFMCQGETFKVRDDGAMTRSKNSEFSGEWRFLGVSLHHWRKGVDLVFNPETNPQQYVGGLVWDYDHGAIRTWGGSYYGKLPRITKAWKEV